MSTKLQREKAKRKLRKEKKKQAKILFNVKKEEQKEEVKVEPEIEIEYITVNPFENDDTALEQFEELKETFEHFMSNSAAQSDDKMQVEQGVTTGKENQPEKEEKLSNKKKKLQRRLPIAVLKSMVERPDLVETHDTCAANPFVLMHLKSYRNTVPVPRHWSQKRKYLQGKRGIEKSTYELPHFIKRTGIMEIRNASLEKDASKALKAKARERLNPSMGKIDIDYQILHDAFFKWQTKPNFTGYGDVYYESKEFEVELKEKRPGLITQKLKEALGMVDGAPTPWLHNMQRIGPPPSYPGLRIPGLNAPLPPGAAYGFHPGGWGKPPMDHHGRPLYAEALVNLTEDQAKYYEYQHWGQLPPEIHVEESVEEQPEESSSSDAEKEGEEGAGEEYDPLAADDDGMETPLSGLDTPANIEGQLRKRKKDLYEVLEETEAHVSSKDIYGSTHKYLIDKKQLKGHEMPGEQVELSIDPSEITTLTEDALKKRAADKFSALENNARGNLANEEQAEQKKRKRANTSEKSKKKKKTNDFKF